MEGLRLHSLGGALPSNVVDNEMMAQRVDTSDEWITTRTGIRQRYFCATGESALTLGIAAAKDVLERSGLLAEEIGCVICATLSNDYATPSMACKIQQALCLCEDIPALDVNAACSGFLYGIAVAQGFLAMQGKRRYALVLGCEQLSRFLDMEDRNTCVLFGDGAGAAILERCAVEKSEFALCMGARGSDAIICGGAGAQQSFIQMDGKAVFRFAVEAIPSVIHQLLEDSGLELSEIDWVVCHQANERIIDHCVKKLHANPAQFYKNMSRFGNTSAASIPIALNEMQEKGLLQAGQRILCVGFGGGLSWAGALLRL